MPEIISDFNAISRDRQQDREIMPDYLHLSGKGYDIWGKAIKTDLEKLTKQVEVPEAGPVRSAGGLIVGST